jgi:hypothetical protein
MKLRINPRPSVAVPWFRWWSRRVARRFSDVQLRQLRQLRRAYDGRRDGPELLTFGDSSMYWTGPGDSSRSYLCDMIRAELGGVRSLDLYAAGYNGRIIKPYLTALERCRSRPRAVLVPTSVQMAGTVWLAHPEYGYEMVAGQLAELVGSDGNLPRQLDRPGVEEEDAYHRMPAPSMTGASWNVGEIQLLESVRGRTRSQKADRMRHNMDMHYAERFDSDTPGVRLVADLGAALREMGLPSVAYIQPVNYELLGKVLHPDIREHLEHNARLVEEAFLEGIGEGGTVINAISDSEPAEFWDPVHLNYDGRCRFAARLAAALRPMLGTGRG